MTPEKVKRILTRSAGILAALLILLFITAGISAFVCSRTMKVTQYDVNLDGIKNPVRLVVLSDIHGKLYGDDNRTLCDLVAAQEPDAIALLGDLFPTKAAVADKEYVIHLTEQMQDIAQVYFAMGNHETDYTARYGESWIEEIRDTGAILLDESWKDLELGGNRIRIGGSMGHGYFFGRSREEFEASDDYRILTEMQESPYPAILLAHWPDTVALSDGPERWEIDLVLCGHTHGGVVRLPGIGGVYAPLQGWWPRYDYGEYQLNEHMRMIITSGLSGHDKLPRIFNLPEICVINLS